MNKKYSKIIFKAMTSIILGAALLFTGCADHNDDAIVTVRFNGNNIPAAIQPFRQ